MPSNALKKSRKRDAQRQAVRDRSQFLKIGAMQGPRVTKIHQDEIETMPMTVPEPIHVPIMPVAAVAEHDAIAMTQEEFDGIRDQARTKKKSFAKVAEPAGWTLVDDGDAKTHQDWVRAR